MFYDAEVLFITSCFPGFSSFFYRMQLNDVIIVEYIVIYVRRGSGVGGDSILFLASGSSSSESFIG